MQGTEAQAYVYRPLRDEHAAYGGNVEHTFPVSTVLSVRNVNRSASALC